MSEKGKDLRVLLHFFLSKSGVLGIMKTVPVRIKHNLAILHVITLIDLRGLSA